MNLKSKRIAGILFFLAISSNVMFAQVNQTQQTQTQVQQTEVTDSELEDFAQAFQAMRMLNQQVQQEMAGVVEGEGMEIQRFNEIHQATVDPQREIDATEEERQQYQNITSEIQERQTSFQQQIEETISDADMSMERYEQIATQLQNDPELQERLREVFQD